MATCATCKNEETASFENSVPICRNCATIRDANAKHAPQQRREIQTTLVDGLCKATTDAHIANVEFGSTLDEFPTGLPRPAGSDRVNKASRKLSDAREEQMTAHNRLSDFLARGIVPEDLKPPE
jgi:hypothetical protein